MAITSLGNDCSLIQKMLARLGGTDIRKARVARLALVIREFQLDQLGCSKAIPLTPAQIRVLDAVFINSGPFKFRPSNSVTSHLRFNFFRPEEINIFWDGQEIPGSRGLIYQDNLLCTASKSFPILAQDWQISVSA